jgi:PBSX family phage terminase large subunit
MYNRTAKQNEAFDLLGNNSYNEYLFYGGSRSGKTFSYIEAIVARAMKEQSRHAIIRRFFSDCKQSIWLDTLPKCIELVYPALNQYLQQNPRCWNKSDFYLKIPNRYTTNQNKKFSEIWIGGLDTSERTDKILGREYSTILFNEISQIDYSSFSIAKTRVAEKNALVNKIYSDCNPPKMSHWTHEYFMEKIDPVSKEIRKNARVGTMFMNPIHNTENIDPQYIEMLKGLPPLLRARFLNGEWCSDETDIFRAEWIRPSEELPLLENIHTKFTFVDPAVTEKARETDNSCESSIITIAIDYNMVIHEIETIHGLFSYKQLKDICYNCFKQHHSVSNYLLGVEDVQAQRWLGEDLNELGIPIEYVRPDADKVRRAISVSDLFEKGKVRINDNYLRRQLLGFPGEKLKDCVDAIVHALRLARDYIKEPTQKVRNRLNEADLDANSRNFWKQELEEEQEAPFSYEDFGDL